MCPLCDVKQITETIDDLKLHMSSGAYVDTMNKLRDTYLHMEGCDKANKALERDVRLWEEACDHLDHQLEVCTDNREELQSAMTMLAESELALGMMREQERQRTTGWTEFQHE